MKLLIFLAVLLPSTLWAAPPLAEALIGRYQSDNYCRVQNGFYDRADISVRPDNVLVVQLWDRNYPVQAQSYDLKKLGRIETIRDGARLIQLARTQQDTAYLGHSRSCVTPNLCREWVRDVVIDFRSPRQTYLELYGNGCYLWRY